MNNTRKMHNFRIQRINICLIVVMMTTIFILPMFVSAKYYAGELNGKILLQVEENGEAWYVYPGNSQRYFLGRPADAFAIMKKLSLGAKHDFIANTAW